jgi:hypothetical protein
VGELKEMDVDLAMELVLEEATLWVVDAGRWAMTWGISVEFRASFTRWRVAFITFPVMCVGCLEVVICCLAVKSALNVAWARRWVLMNATMHLLVTILSRSPSRKIFYRKSSLEAFP